MAGVVDVEALLEVLEGGTREVTDCVVGRFSTQHLIDGSEHVTLSSTLKMFKK